MSTASVLPYKQERGRDSSRVIVLGNADGLGRPKILVTREKYFGDEVLRLPGGKCHFNEEPIDCASRELKEETGYRKRDGRTKLRHVFTFPGKEYNHSTVVFMCGFTKVPRLEKEKTHWIGYSEIISLWEDYVGPNNCPIQPKHLDYLREFYKNHSNLLEEIKDHVTVQDKTKSA